MNILTRFGIIADTYPIYTFPADAQVNYACDFGKLDTYISGLPGVHGGISGLGSGRGKANVGTVKVDLWLHFDNPNDASDKIDSLRQLQDWGLQPLFMQPTVGGERFCWARLVGAALKQDVHDLPHVRQLMTLVFEVPDPFWYGQGTERVWGDGGLWNDGGLWGAGSGAAAFASKTDGDTITATVGGTIYTHAHVLVENTSGVDASDLVIRRTVAGIVMDEIRYSGTLINAQGLEISARAQTVLLMPAGTDAIANFEARTADWLRLMPGSNTLDIILGDGSLDMAVRWFERYV